MSGRTGCFTSQEPSVSFLADIDLLLFLLACFFLLFEVLFLDFIATHCESLKTEEGLLDTSSPEPHPLDMTKIPGVRLEIPQKRLIQ